jgi:hypothetical protein
MIDHPSDIAPFHCERDEGSEPENETALTDTNVTPGRLRVFVSCALGLAPRATDLVFWGAAECCDIELQPQVSPLAARSRSASDKVGMLWRRLRIRSLRMR